jgi:hypothetical protein
MVDPSTAVTTYKTLATLAKAAKEFVDRVDGLTQSARAENAMERILVEIEEERVATDRELLRKMAPLVVELHERILATEAWRSQPEGEQPTAHDVGTAALALLRRVHRAGSNRKREVLFRAFFSGFDPKLFREGMSRYLWNTACDLEYPTLRVLKELECEGTDREGVAVSKLKARWPHVAELRDRHLVHLSQETERSARAWVTDIGRALFEFAWSEEENDPAGSV